jgi:predicted nucleotidyltransferase
VHLPSVQDSECLAQHRTGIATIDVDFLIEFAADATPGLQDFFGAKTALEHLLGRAVDLVEPGAVRNPYVLASINRNREAVYAA